MSGQRTPRGLSTSPAASSAYNTRADLIPFPSNSILSGRSPLERSDVSQSLRDVGIVLLISFTGLAFGVGLFLLAFVEI